MSSLGWLRKALLLFACLPSLHFPLATSGKYGCSVLGPGWEQARQVRRGPPEGPRRQPGLAGGPAHSQRNLQAAGACCYRNLDLPGCHTRGGSRSLGTEQIARPETAWQDSTQAPRQIHTRGELPAGRRREAAVLHGVAAPSLLPPGRCRLTGAPRSLLSRQSFAGARNYRARKG